MQPEAIKQSMVKEHNVIKVHRWSISDENSLRKDVKNKKVKVSRCSFLSKNALLNGRLLIHMITDAIADVVLPLLVSSCFLLDSLFQVLTKHLYENVQMSQLTENSVIRQCYRFGFNHLVWVLILESGVGYKNFLCQLFLDTQFQVLTKNCYENGQTTQLTENSMIRQCSRFRHNCETNLSKTIQRYS